MRTSCCLCLPVRLCIPLNFSVSYAVLVVSKETRRLFLPKCHVIYCRIVISVCLFREKPGSLCLEGVRIIGFQ
jgi:hypothetical protein